MRNQEGVQQTDCVNGFSELLTQKFVEIFNEAENHYDRRSCQPKKEQDCEDMHDELQNSGHVKIVNQAAEMQRLSKRMKVLNSA